MKCSSGSTGSSGPWVWLALTALLAGGGCAHSRRPAARPPAVYGRVDLDVLVRSHPGWAGVARYDASLARLDAATARPVPSLPDDWGLNSLAAAPEGGMSAPVLSLTGPRRRLQQVERVQVARLVARQAESRRRQIALERVGWERQAQAQYDRARASAEAAYGRRLDRLASDREARALNLALQIRALQKIVAGWDRSRPPTPALNRARAELVQKQAALAALDMARRNAGAQAVAERDAALAEALRLRSASVEAQVVQEELRLRAQDRQQVAALQAGLSAQRAALLREVQDPQSAPVAPAGTLGPQSLPAGPAPVTLPPQAVRSLRAARQRLWAQRTRWVAFLYGDTRAAALDAAGQRHWIVSFGRGPAPGGRDLTAALAQALAAHDWKS